MAKKSAVATAAEIAEIASEPESENQDITVGGEEMSNEAVAFADVEDMTPDQLKAELLAARNALAKKGRKAKVEEPKLSPEELAERQEKIDAAQTKVDSLTNELNEAKAVLNELKPRRMSVAKRGPVGVGAFIKSLIAEGLTNEEIMERLPAQFPDNNTNVNCVNWYRNALKKWPDGKRPSAKASTETTDETTDEAA